MFSTDCIDLVYMMSGCCISNHQVIEYLVLFYKSINNIEHSYIIDWSFLQINLEIKNNFLNFTMIFNSCKGNIGDSEKTE